MNYTFNYELLVFLKVIYSLICCGTVNYVIDYFDSKFYYKSNNYIINYKAVYDKKVLISENLKRQWYLIHTIFNFIIAYLTIPDIINIINDPLSGTKGILNTTPICIMLALHIYHILMFKKYLTIIDWIHHIVSSFLVGAITILYYKVPLVNFVLFFMCGVPGGIDYACLTLLKYNIISKYTEKKINVFQNNWIRNPGIIIGCVLGYVNYIYNNNYNIGVVGTLFVLNVINSIYFSQRVTINYGEYKQKLKEIKK